MRQNRETLEPSKGGSSLSISPTKLRANGRPMRTQASSQQIVSRTEAQRSARESADDQQRFSEGFISGWYSLMGYRIVPTIIPDCEIPVGKSPFEHGYDQARSFLECVQEHWERQTRSQSASSVTSEGVRRTRSGREAAPVAPNLGASPPRLSARNKLKPAPGFNFRSMF
jgi:hypothetical protein